jgi:CRISPR-associated protein Csb2
LISIEFRFPAGRYHATPWNRQVNEGIVEWPPNPWRIVRAIISTYYLKMKSEYDDEILKGVIEKLGSLPVYRLPPASLGHTRHYMPLYGIDKSSMIFDTFVSVKKDERIVVSWPDQDLDKEENEFLSECLKKLQYLGRAESWVEASMFDERIVPNCVPADFVKVPEGDLELVDVIVPMSPDEYDDWSEEWKKDHSSKKKNKIANDIFEALTVETTVLKSNGWSQPPGSKWVQYLRKTDCFDVKPENRYVHTQEKKPTVARYQVASQAPPRLTDTISVTERVHTALVSYSDQSWVFTGCDENKVPLEGHDHAHIFCESNMSSRSGIRGEITHVTLFTPEGFGKK